MRRKKKFLVRIHKEDVFIPFKMRGVVTEQEAAQGYAAQDVEFKTKEPKYWFFFTEMLYRPTEEVPYWEIIVIRTPKPILDFQI